MMNDMARWTAQGVAVRRKPVDLRSGMAGAVGGLITLLALAAGVVIAVVFAATLAVIMALATALLALSALAWRMRPRKVAQRAEIALPRGGHAWVAYSWDRPNR